MNLSTASQLVSFPERATISTAAEVFRILVFLLLSDVRVQVLFPDTIGKVTVATLPTSPLTSSA